MQLASDFLTRLSRPLHSQVVFDFSVVTPPLQLSSDVDAPTAQRATRAVQGVASFLVKCLLLDVFNFF